MKKIFILLIISLLLPKIGSAHSVLEMEQLLQEKGLIRSLKSHQASLKWSEEKMNVFVYKNYKELDADIQMMVDKAFYHPVSKAQLTDFLNQKSDYYQSKMKAFHEEVQSNPKIFGDAIAEIQATTSAQSATACANVGFEQGVFTNWTVRLGQRVDCEYEESTTDLSCFGFLPSTYAAANAPNLIDPPKGERLEIIHKNTAPLYDDFVGGKALKRVNSEGGDYAIRLENKLSGYGATEISYTFTVDASNPFYEYHFAAVLEDPGTSHDLELKPFFSVRLYDANNDEIKCARYVVVADDRNINYGNTNIYKEVPNNPNFKYCDWQKQIIPLKSRIGETLTIKFLVSDCPWGGHLGYAYVDGSCFNANITQSACEPDGTRELSFAEGFDAYVWRGKKIIGSNSESSVIVNGSGKFGLKYYAGECDDMETFTPDPCTQPPNPSCVLSITTPSVGICDADNEYDVSGTINISTTNYTGPKHILVTCGSKQQLFKHVETSSVNYSFENLYSDGEQHTIKAYLFNDLFFEETSAICTTSTTYTSPISCYGASLACNCIGSFAPFPANKSVHSKLESGKYIVGAWVKEGGASVTQITYSNPYLKVNFYDHQPTGGSVPIATSTFNSKGLIIEGWQRLQEEITIPAAATYIEVELGTSSGDAYFDDIRIYPVDASMQSYVYDPVSLKLQATLDENNYATFYEYDQEGNLTRTKKETERGVITIQEARKSTIKQ